MTTSAGRDPAGEVIAAARAMRRDDLRALARAGNRALGYLATKRGSLDAMVAAQDAGIAAGLEQELIEGSNDSLLAVLDAAAEVAHQQGRSVGGFRVEVDRFRGHDQDAEAVRRLNDASRRTLGWQLQRWVAPASLVTHMATVAILTWDLAEAGSEYTPEVRARLVRPWLEVAPLPQGLS